MTTDLEPVTDTVEGMPVNGTADFEPIILAFCCNY